MTNMAPYGTPARMRLLLAVGALSGVVLLAIGVVVLAAGGRGGVLCIVLGAAFLVLFAIMGRVGKRLGKV